jgi:hypothetical protein
MLKGEHKLRVFENTLLRIQVSLVIHDFITVINIVMQMHDHLTCCNMCTHSRLGMISHLRPSVVVELVDISFCLRNFVQPINLKVKNDHHEQM